jgi:hypothetical protein
MPYRVFPCNTLQLRYLTQQRYTVAKHHTLRPEITSSSFSIEREKYESLKKLS